MAKYEDIKERGCIGGNVASYLSRFESFMRHLNSIVIQTDFRLAMRYSKY